MAVNWSLQLGNVRGIVIQVHLTFLLVVVWAALQWGFILQGGLNGALFGIVLVILLFACVVLHELGHSLVAQHFGIRVRDITLLPIGGVARLERMPERARHEFWIAIAGPAVNVVLAIALWVILATVAPPLSAQALVEVYTRLNQPTGISLLTFLFTSNITLAVFNLLPAFPLDGGRVLRAVLATRLDFVRATEIAVAVGQGIAIIFGFLGILQGNIFLIAIAAFIYLGAGQEGQETVLRRRLRGLRAGDIVNYPTVAFRESDSLAEAVEAALHSYQTEFPVVESGRLVGLLTHAALIRGLRDLGMAAQVKDVMQVDFPRAGSSATLFELRELMMKLDSGVVAVFEGDRFIGLTTPHDISGGIALLAALDKRTPSDAAVR